jgi:hypothetical protein
MASAVVLILEKPLSVRISQDQQRSYSYLAWWRSDWLLAVIFSVKEGSIDAGRRLIKRKASTGESEIRVVHGIEVR